MTPLECSPLHVLLVIFSILAATSAAAAPERTPNATTTSSSSPTTCPSYRCGHAVDIRYPFWIDDGNTSSSSDAHCGYPTLRLECRRDTPVLPLPSGDYAVTHILYADMTVSLLDLGVFSLSNTCPLVGRRNLSLPSGSPLSLTPRDANLTFFVHCSFVGIPAHLVACLEGDGRHHSYVFRDGDQLAPYGYAGLCQEVIAMPVLRRSLVLGGGASGSPLDAVVSALNMGFELSWRPVVDGECGQCEKAGGLCGRRRGPEEHGPWTFACFRAAATPASWIAPKYQTVLALLVLLPPPLAAAQPDDVTASCAPASCGNLTIKYPFYLSGHQPPHCGYPSFGVACDPTGSPPFLNESYLRVLDIHYGNSSVVAFHANLADDPTGCRATKFNMSSILALSLLSVNRNNWELLLLSGNCSRPPAGSSSSSIPMNCTGSGEPWFLHLSRSYDETAGAAVEEVASTATGCQYSAVPVMPGSELREMGDYERLVRGGFMMEWTVPGDCAACNASGGQCQFETEVNAFRCLCHDGSTQPATCARGQFY